MMAMMVMMMTLAIPEVGLEHFLGPPRRFGLLVESHAEVGDGTLQILDAFVPCHVKRLPLPHGFALRWQSLI